jgi:hypothetical protein
VLGDVVYSGFVDVVDISRLILTNGLARSKSRGWMSRLVAKLKADKEHQVERAVNASGLDPFRWISMNSNLKEVNCCWLGVGYAETPPLPIQHSSCVTAVIAR